MKHLQKLLLLLVLLVAGVQSAWAQTWECWTSYSKDGITYNMNRLLDAGSELIFTKRRATIASITATGDVTIPYFDDRYDYWVSDIGWDYESQTPVDINCTSYLTSLTFNASKGSIGEFFTIHGTFSLENLYGPLAFYERYSSAEQHVVCTKIAQGAWIKIPHATSISYKNLQVDGFIEARSISSLTVPLCVSETGLIQAHTAKTVTVPQGTTIAGIVQAPKATKVVVSSNTSIMETGQIIVDAPKNVEIKGGDFFGTFRSDSLTKITLGQVDFGISGKLRCPMLTDIYIPDKNKIPNFIGYYSERFTAPQNTITVHVYDMSPSEIASMKNSAVWNGFKEVVSHKSEVKATLSSNGGGEVQLWKKTGTNSQMQYTMSSNGGEEIVTLYDNADSYQIRLYYDNANYETPVLRRNGVEVITTDSGNGYCYYNETDHMNVNRYSVSYNMKVYRKLHIVNLGNGRVRLTGLIDGVEKAFTINGAADLYYGFDNTRYVGVEITPEEGYEVQRIKLYGRIPISFSTNATTGITTTQYYFTDDEKEQSLYVYYKKKTIPDGTSFNVHMSVEGTLGIGAVFFDDDGDYDWSDSDIESNDFSYQMDPGGSENVIGIYHPADGPTMGFSVVNYLSAEEIAAGFTCTVKVYSNRGEVVSSGPSEWGGDYYSIPLDGTDTDVRVVFETNGRYIRGNNGDGGTVEIYCEGDDTPSSITESGFWFYPLLPKTGNPYAVITPQEGKTVTAILRDGSLLSPSAFLQSDGTYRVPLQDFDRGDSYYEIYIIYSDDMAVVESTGITWSGIAMGEKLEDANMFEVMLNDDATNYRIFTSQGTTSSTFNQKFDDDVSSLKVNLIVKDGYDFKVYFNGEEFPHTFTKSTLNAEQGLFLYSFETTNVATIIPFLVDGTWVVEFKKPAGITWSAIAVGDVPQGASAEFIIDEDSDTPMDIEVDNATSNGSGTYLSNQLPPDIQLYVNVPAGYQFKVWFNGEEYTNRFWLYSTSNEGIQSWSYYTSDTEDITPLAVDGTWVVEFKKADLLTQHIQLTGEQLGSVWMQYLDSDGADYDDAYAGNEDPYVTFTSEEKIYIKGAKPCITVPDGYTFKVWFNGQEVTGFTLENNSYVVTLDESFITDGTWVVEFKKGITWTAVATGDVAEGMLDSGVESGVEIELNNQDDLELVEVMLSPSNTHNTGTFNFGVSDGDITPTGMHAWIYCKPGYELSSVTFNGVEYIESFDIQTSGVNSLYTLSLNISDGLSPFLVDGTWVVEFKKVEGITWNGMIIGDVPQGAVVDLGLDGMTMEVFLNAEETSASDTYTGSTEGVGMNADITVPTGYNFKVWFNGEEKSTIFTYDHTMSNGKKVYIYNSNENSQNAPYLQDGQWIILFYDDLERYDVNRDGQISIADVTTLVNKILGKPTN